MTRNALIIILFGTAALFAALSFVRQPSITKEGSAWTIDFELSEYSDVEISIVDKKDSSVIRHLAAGKLGSNAPAFLQKNSLRQNITWDGKDDFGVNVPQPDSMSVRVRAGMSTHTDMFVGEDLYLFVGGGRATPSIILEDDGNVILFGKSGSNSFLRKYDAAGNYARTLYPPSASLSSDSVVAYGINVLPGVGWAPKITAPKSPTMTNSYLNDGNTFILSGGSGKLVLVNGNNQQTITTSGCYISSTTKPLISSPAAPVGWKGPWGPQYLTPSHNPKFLYLSGRYYGNTNLGSWLTEACDTGFWADGQVFKVNLENGIVSPFIKLDSVPVLATERATKIGGAGNGYSAIHGTAIDDSGRVYVCDRLHKCIGVYDTNAVMLGSIPVADPDYVAVSKRTGAIYVISRTHNVNLTLRRFNSWRNPASPTATVQLTTSTGDGYKGASAMVLTETNGITNIWLGYGTIGFRLYRDEVTTFSLLRDFSTGNSLMHYDRIAVDRKTDQLFFEVHRASRNGIYTVTDWSNPEPAPIPNLCGNTGSGDDNDDITVCPKGDLYIYKYPGGNDYYNFPVFRFHGKTGNYQAKNYANTGSNVVTAKTRYEGTNHRGLAVGWQGQVAISNYDGADHDNNHIDVYPDTGYFDSTYKGKTMVSNLTSKASGIRFDAAGNLYVGTGVKPSDWQVLNGFAGDNFYNNYSGSIVKYAPGDTGYMSGNVAIGSAKVFPQPFGTYGGSGTRGWCTCWNPRFDVDPYGRVYIPSAASQSVAIADNEGNTLHQFGRYGNTDARGGVAGSGIVENSNYVPFAFPYSTAASEDYIYVSDWINARIVRVKLDYQLDNIPGLTENTTSVADFLKKDRRVISMASSPNPFNPSSTISITLPSAVHVRLAVYDANGRFVKELFNGIHVSGTHNFTWNGTNTSGIKVSTGLYFYRLTAGKETRIIKTIFSK
ncbi:MAG: T9SS type A sorting domain-containing protein [Fibrobacteres bacterium]|nr:T9SS type A sorting domain-containing protein [Fibrobacterota bacterium]